MLSARSKECAPPGKDVPADDKNSSSRNQLMATLVELTIRLGVLVLLLYWSFILVFCPASS